MISASLNFLDGSILAQNQFFVYVLYVKLLAIYKYETNINTGTHDFDLILETFFGMLHSSSFLNGCLMPFPFFQHN